MSIPRTVVIKTLALLRELNREYGHEKAMDIWGKLSDIIDDGDLTMEVFKAMLNGGKVGTHIEIIRWDGGQKVSSIKALRRWTGLGLKDAKDFTDAASAGQVNTIELWHTEANTREDGEIKYGEMIAELDSLGFTFEVV